MPDFGLLSRPERARRGLERELESTGLKRFFHATRCADETLSKPNPAMLVEIITSWASLPRARLMIGDTTHDLEMAEVRVYPPWR